MKIITEIKGTATHIGSKRKPHKSVSKYLGGDSLIQRSRLQKKGNQHRSQAIYEKVLSLIAKANKRKEKQSNTNTGMAKSSVNLNPEIPELTGPLK